jgi:catechol 2,3-dioxygenase-like lactoylglutathione lyase family enzyme
MKKLTPVLNVDAIEPCLPFWVDRLGFEKTAEMPHEGSLGFVILKRDAVEVMYETRAAVDADLGAPMNLPTGGAMLYIEVDDLDDVERRLDGVPHVIPRRETFYGADEILVREPGGNLVLFAHFGG